MLRFPYFLWLIWFPAGATASKHFIEGFLLRQKLELTWDYFRLACKRAFLPRFIRARIKKARLLGTRVEFPEFDGFVLQMEEIFIMQPYASPIASPAPFIIDGGANIGLSTLYFKMLYPSARILAFEPHPALASFFRRNMSANGIKGVELVEVALSDKAGKADLFVASESRAPGANSLSEGFFAHKPHGLLKVDATELAPFVSGAIDLLKLDIEGSEGKVLENLEAKQKLEWVRALVVEYHHNIPDETGLARALAILEHAGFAYNIRTLSIRPMRTGECQNLLIQAQRS